MTHDHIPAPRRVIDIAAPRPAPVPAPARRTPAVQPRNLTRPLPLMAFVRRGPVDAARILVAGRRRSSDPER